jgi:DNA-binding SARP family transcriptional activator/tetratricopeptide (TPR) repeat protein
VGHWSNRWISAGLPRRAWLVFGLMSVTPQLRHGTLRLSLLGPVVADRDGIAVDLGPPRQRAVLAVLALSPGRLVQRDAIIDAVWGERPPASAVNLVQTYVSRLRRALCPGPLSSAGTSYRLDLGAAQLDLLRFQDLAAASRQARGGGDAAAAAAAARQGLDLWRGDPLADLRLLAHYPPVAALADERLTLLAEYADCCERLRRSDEALPLLRAAAARHPLDERIAGRLMAALAATGRTAQALQAHRDLRQRLRTELGVSPGTDVARTHERILRADTGTAVPWSLPRPAPAFSGRAAQLAAMTAAVAEADAAGRPRPVWVISGPAGAGKSTLAVHWAHTCAARFPDGQVHVDLRGFHPSGRPVRPAETVRVLLDLLQVSAAQLPASPDAQLSLYRSLLASRRMLLILDNARDAAQVRPLLPGGPGCMALVTSRARLTGLAVTDGARLAPLGPLSRAEARELLAAGGAAEDPAAPAADEIIDRCGRLPLALAIVAARAQSVPLSRLVAELRGPGRLAALSVLDAGDPAADVRAVFSWSFRALSPAAARLFRLLGLHPGPDISVPAVASLAGTEPTAARTLAAELTRLHLVTEPAPGRLALHDLLRAFAIDEAAAAETPSARSQATHRMLDHYLHSAHAAARALTPTRDPLPLAAPQPGTGAETIDGRSTAEAWLRAEYPVLVHLITLAEAQGWDEHAWQLPWALLNFFDRVGHWQDWIDTHQSALRAARRQGSAIGQATSHENISLVYISLGRHDEAREHLDDALQLYTGIGVQPGQGRSLLNISRLLEMQGRHGEAIEAAEAALGVYAEVGHDGGQARALNAIGWNSAHAGDAARAIECCQRALEIHTRIGNWLGQAATLDSLGLVHASLGEHTAAIARYEAAWDLLGRGGRSFQHAKVLAGMAASQHAAADAPAARRAWREALSILRELGHPDADQVQARLQEAGL